MPKVDKVFLGTDHKGFEIKEKLKEALSASFNVVDCGAFERDSQDDYPDFIKEVAKLVSSGENSFGIILGHSGQGEAIVANRYKNIRAVVYTNNNLEIIKLAREHNDANILSIGASFVSYEEILKAIELFLNTPFSNEERHKRRIKKIDLI